MSESRTRKSIKNSVVALAFFAIQFVLGFYSRKIFLDRLGTEILGLNTTATNILQFLNLAELGISSAVIFSLYKPLHNKDHDQINEIVTLQGKFYSRIATMIIAGAIIVMFFFPQIFHKMKLPMWYAYASFGVLLYSQLLGYFINYRQIVLTASQMDYKVQTSVGVVHLIKIVSQIVALSISVFPYIWWLILEFAFSTVSCLVLNVTINRTCKYLRKSKLSYQDLKSKYSVILKKTKQAFFHHIGVFALSQSSPIIIYAYASLSMVALYGNYLIISTGLKRMVTAFFGGVSAGIGDLIAEGNRQHIIEVFFQLFSLRFMISAWVAYSMLALSQVFIKVWIGNQYLLPYTTLIIMVWTLYIGLNRNTVGIFLAGYGQYQDIWSPIIEASINVGLSILLGYYFGLNGILSGVLISLIILIELWKPFFLFKYGLKEPVLKYFKNYLKLLFIAISLGYIVFKLTLSLTEWGGSSWLNLFLFGLLNSGGYLIVLFLSLFILSKDFRIVTQRFICRK